MEDGIDRGAVCRSGETQQMERVGQEERGGGAKMGSSKWASGNAMSEVCAQGERAVIGPLGLALSGHSVYR